mmetsp:Transcript_94856/g.268516  ORF Transcript_94856/g.268516 Transcript_94856/m.268516 type:complete len:282 (+) Transcript_94856:1219-2064(+)
MGMPAVVLPALVPRMAGRDPQGGRVVARSAGGGSPAAAPARGLAAPAADARAPVAEGRPRARGQLVCLASPVRGQARSTLRVLLGTGPAHKVPAEGVVPPMQCHLQGPEARHKPRPPLRHALVADLDLVALLEGHALTLRRGRLRRPAAEGRPEGLPVAVLAPRPGLRVQLLAADLGGEERQLPHGVVPLLAAEPAPAVAVEVEVETQLLLPALGAADVLELLRVLRLVALLEPVQMCLEPLVEFLLPVPLLVNNAPPREARRHLRPRCGLPPPATAPKKG